MYLANGCVRSSLPRWKRDSLVGGEAHFSLTLPDSMLPDDEEGRAQFDALAEVIQGVSLAGGMGRLDDGYRVELAALTPRHPATTSTSPARPT